MKRKGERKKKGKKKKERNRENSFLLVVQHSLQRKNSYP